MIMSFMPLNSRVGSSKEPKMHCHGRSKGLLSRIFLFNKYLYKRENCTVYIVFNYVYIYMHIWACIFFRNTACRIVLFHCRSELFWIRICLGTVEYLYNANENKFYFLELNPRLQVEHPVTEELTRVNLPATQVLVCCGVPLEKIPQIRRFYGKSESDTTSPINFLEDRYVYPDRHVIASRITAENPDDGFKPTSGKNLASALCLMIRMVGRRVLCGMRFLLPCYFVITLLLSSLS